MTQQVFERLMQITSNYFRTSDRIYKIGNLTPQEVDDLAQEILTDIIGGLNYTPNEILRELSLQCLARNRFIRSYYAIFERLYEILGANRPQRIPLVAPVFDYFFYQNHGFTLSGQHPIVFRDYQIQNITLDVHAPNTIYRAIMDDDQDTFITFISNQNFNPERTLKSDFYDDPEHQYTYLELCCYHGAVNCFKAFRTIHDDIEISDLCLPFAYLGGNLEIIDECLKHIKPDDKCMEYAIMSHNIDFIMNLVYEYGIEINLEYCMNRFNVEAYCVFCDLVNNIDQCFIYSPCFHCLPLVQYFLDQGANVNEKNQFGYTALHFASWGNFTNIIDLLLQSGAEVNVQDNRGWTPLHNSMYYCVPIAAQRLIQNNADVNIKTNRGKNALHIAAEKNMHQTAALIIHNIQDINEKDNAGKTALHYAAIENSSETAELLILNHAYINAKDNSGRTPLHEAAENNSKETAEILIQNEADINAESGLDQTPLHLAAANKSHKVVELLVPKKPDLNAIDNNGKTALYYAVTNDMSETIELLIKSKANINEKYEKNQTFLHIAVNNKCIEATKTLLHLVDKEYINAGDDDGRSALHVAAETIADESLQIAELLIQYEANINAKDHKGRTPLHIATAKNFVEMVFLLIQHDSDVTAKDDENHTALDLAKLLGYNKIENLLPE